MLEKIILASPRGYCAGVNRAIDILEKVIQKYKKNIYMNHEIVHNRSVVDYFLKKGVMFESDPLKIPKNSVYVFSAHGTSKNIVQLAEKNNLICINAVCPLVDIVHIKIKKYLKDGFDCFYIGHKNHQETKGVLSLGNVLLIENLNDIEKLKNTTSKKIVFTQTTLSVYDTEFLIKKIKEKFPDVQFSKKGDICYATTNRQNAIKNLANLVEKIIIVGSKTSSNSNRLKELAIDLGTESILIDDFSKLNLDFLKDVKKLGISSGASVPDYLVQNLIKNIQKEFLKNIKIEELKTTEEKTIFPIIKNL